MNADKILLKLLHDHGYRKIRRVTDEATGTVLDTISIPRNDGTTIEADFAPSDQTQGKMAARLRDLDACLPADKRERAELLEAMSDLVPKQRFRYAARTGWSDNRSTFVMPHTVIGGGDGMIGLSPRAQDPGKHLATCGTLEGWRVAVAKPAELSSTLILCVAVSFATPLLAIAGEQPYGICVFGQTRVGKSRGMLAAASVIGIGVQDRLPSWDATDPGFQRLLARHNNLVCPIDDVMNMGVRGAARANRLEKLAYSLSSGQARLHSSAYDKEHARDSHPWSTIVLTSSEEPISNTQGRAGRQKGSALRLMDLPAILTGNDMFDRLQVDDGTDRTKLVERHLSDITKGCAAHHGTAFEHYVAFLINHRADLAGWVEAAIKRFQDHVRHDTTDSAMTRDVARKFGLIFAGAQIAIRAGTVEWKEVSALASITIAYHAARQLLPDDALDLRRGLANLSRRLRELPSVRTWHRQDTDERPKLSTGYRWHSGRAHHCMVKTEAFVATFDSQAQRRAVERFLISRQYVEVAQSRTSVAEHKPMKQHVWVDGSRTRSLRIDVPLLGFYGQT